MAGGTGIGDRNSLALGSRGQHGCVLGGLPIFPPPLPEVLKLRKDLQDREILAWAGVLETQRQKSNELPLEASLKSFPQQPQCPFHRWSRHRGQAWGLDSCLLRPCLGHLFFNFYSPTSPPFLLFSAKMSSPQALPLALLWWETSRLTGERQGLAKED